MSAIREDWQVLVGLFPAGWEELGRRSGAVTRLRGFESLNLTLLMRDWKLAKAWLVRELSQ